MILAIDPGNEKSAYVIMYEDSLSPVEYGLISNNELLEIVEDINQDEFRYTINHFAIEMVASYGMAVGKTVFDTCVWIGRFYQLAYDRIPRLQYIYRKDEKMNLCNNMRAKDSNITQALIDRFAPNTPNKGKGNKKSPGWFYGFKKDIWQAYAVGVTYYDMYIDKLPFE